MLQNMRAGCSVLIVICVVIMGIEPSYGLQLPATDLTLSQVGVSIQATANAEALSETPLWYSHLISGFSLMRRLRLTSAFLLLATNAFAATPKLPPLHDHLQGNWDAFVFLSFAIQLIGGLGYGAWALLKLHENAHASVLERHGIPYTIHLGLPVGYVEIQGEAAQRSWEQLPLRTQAWHILKPAVLHIVMAMGSFTGLWLFARFFGIPFSDSLVYAASLGVWMMLNGIFAIINLIPFEPSGHTSDGLALYRLLRSAA